MPMMSLAQDDSDNSLNQRTPEQEATKQTEKLQSELNLTSEQVKAIYQINLKYAQARKNAIRRADAMQIIKNKDESLRKILTPQQNQQLETRRASRQQPDVDGGTQYLRTNPVQRNARDEDRRRTETRNTQSTSREANTSRESGNRDEQPTRASATNSSQSRSSEGRSSSASRSSESRSSSTSSTTRSSDSGSSSRSAGRR